MRKRAHTLTITGIAVGLFLIVLAWYLASHLLISKGNHILPYPHLALYRALKLLFWDGAAYTWTSIGYTIGRVLLGFASAFVLGGVFGVLAGLFKLIDGLFRPGSLLMKAVPTVAVVIVMMGALTAPKTWFLLNYVPSFLTFIVAFPIIFDACRAGIANEDQSIRDSLSLDCGRTSLKGTIRVLIPDAWPYISLSLAQSLGLSFKTAIMAEVLVSSSSLRHGIGAMISLARINGETENIIAYALIALSIALLVDIPFFALKSALARKGYEEGPRA